MYMLLTGLSPFLGNSDQDTLTKVRKNDWQTWESSSKIQQPIREIIEACFVVEPEKRPSIEKIIALVKNVKSRTESDINATRLKERF